MTRNIKQIYKNRLGALDGEFGHVKDFYFGDTDWVIRYLVADTGSWLPGRLVLISPRALGDVYQGGKIISVNLTRRQIEDSPSIDLHKPLSRQYEEEFHQYYGWPYYWEGDALWGMSGFPILTQAPDPFLAEQKVARRSASGSADAHLRSAQAITGYHVQAGDSTVGQLVDFLVDDKDWAIRNLVLNTSSWLSRKTILISPKQINRISWDESRIHLNSTKAALQHAPEYTAAWSSVQADYPGILRH